MSRNERTSQQANRAGVAQKTPYLHIVDERVHYS